MFTFSRPLPLVLGIGLVAIAASAGMASSSNNGLACAVTEQTHNGMRSIEGSVTSPSDVSGQYQFAIKTSQHGNSSTVSQGGPFSVRGNQTTTIGQMQIDAGARYSLDFTVTVDGHTIDCTTTGAIAT